MDMSMMSGTPWLDMPVMLHSDRTYKCSLKQSSQCEYQQGYWRFWYEADHRYALPTVAFFCTAIGLFAVFAFLSTFAPSRVTSSTPVRKLVALNRWLSYRSFRIPILNWNSAPVGILLLGAVGTIFFVAMTLGPQPYYWPNTRTLSYGSSPPLATRTGWMALACLPFVIATSSKSNMITAFTGVSHEKLQVFHRWISYAMFVLGLIHTFPFIVFHVWKGDMITQWNTSVVYWTGVVALLAQAWLTFASMTPLRVLNYEFFKFSHFLAALVFVIFFFLHCDFRLSSWDYFIASGALFSVTWLHSQLRVFFEHGIGQKAHLSLAPNGFIRVVIPTTSTWRAGQHYFIRFFGLGFHAMGSHPFTICSLPERGAFYETKQSEMAFYIRPQGGLTARLAKYVEKSPDATTRVLLDGPYGGCDMQKIATSDRTLVIAGGSGAAFVLPIVEAFLRRMELRAHKDAAVATEPRPSLRIVLATRDCATRCWFEDIVMQMLERTSLSEIAKEDMAVEVYYTGTDENLVRPKLTGQFLSTLEDPEKAPDAITPVVIPTKAASRSGSDSDAASQARSTGAVHIEEIDGRPNLPSLVAAEARAHAGQKMGVFLCGPGSMSSDVANATARENMRLIKEGKGEVYLHMEHFSWA